MDDHSKIDDVKSEDMRSPHGGGRPTIAPDIAPESQGAIDAHRQPPPVPHNTRVHEAVALEDLAKRSGGRKVRLRRGDNWRMFFGVVLFGCALAGPYYIIANALGGLEGEIRDFISLEYALSRHSGISDNSRNLIVFALAARAAVLTCMVFFAFGILRAAERLVRPVWVYLQIEEIRAGRLSPELPASDYDDDEDEQPESEANRGKANAGLIQRLMSWRSREPDVGPLK